MNQVIRELIERKSVRVFTEEHITEEQKNLILEAAVNAPTAGNQQMYTIINVTDQGLKKRLSESCDNQPFIAEADLVLVFCADMKKWYDGFQDVNANPRPLGAGDLLLAVSDTNIAAQNAVTAAWSMGIGSCYIGDIMENCEEQRNILKLPKYIFPAAMLVFGFPTEQQKNREKPKRAPMEKIVFENAYPALSAEDRKALFKNRPGESYESSMIAFCSRKFNSDFSREMTRSVKKYLEDYE